MPTGRLASRFLAFAVAIAVTFGAAGTASAARSTTSPGATTSIPIVITDAKLAVGHGASAARGTYVIFTLRNSSSSTAQFSLLGRVSKPIAPHGRGRLAVFAGRRGAFVAKVKLSSRHILHETFVVY